MKVRAHGDEELRFPAQNDEIEDAYVRFDRGRCAADIFWFHHGPMCTRAAVWYNISGVVR